MRFRREATLTSSEEGTVLPYYPHERYGKILENASLVVYQTDKESSDAGWKFTTRVLSETV